MKHIVTIIQEEIPDSECLPSNVRSLDYDRFQEYSEIDEHPPDSIFEHSKQNVNKVHFETIDGSLPSILKYFLDGSRRTYKIADLVIEGRFLPIIAGQVGVGVLGRIRQDGRSDFKPMNKYCKVENIIVFPDKLNEDDRNHIVEKINENLKINFSGMVYKAKRDADPIDLGRAQIISRMHTMEINAVNAMVNDHVLRDDSLLVIDGSLRFKKREFDIVHFKNVIGIAKSFKPSYSMGKGRGKKDVGSITANMELGERSPVFKIIDEDKKHDKELGIWYMRIRPRKYMSNPLQGVIKIESYARDDNENENGLDTCRVNNISGYILRERNVTPYGKDYRWASHIYPIYLTEQYVKSSFISDIQFKAYFH